MGQCAVRLDLLVISPISVAVVELGIVNA